MQDDIDRGLDKHAAQALGLDASEYEDRHVSWEFRHRFGSLALKAYRRELISEAKLRELVQLVDIPVKVALSLLQEDKQD